MIKYICLIDILKVASNISYIFIRSCYIICMLTPYCKIDFITVINTF